ncbi:MAG: nucleotidyltransferase family protein [Elusimicrobia bacterium]|nr:nucleotidyltransferase family protein [Elusimicrobiota bacterium]
MLGPSLRSYLLAAGRGTRAGGPKAWLPCEGATLLERQLSFLSGLFPPEDTAVSIQPDWLPRCRSMAPVAAWVAVDPSAPSLASLQALFQALPPLTWAFIHHVDMPVWDAGLFSLLAQGLPAEGFDAVVPVNGGKRGHPVALSCEAGRAVLRLDPAKDRLDHWLRGARVKTVEVPQACALENWNQGVPGR